MNEIITYLKLLRRNWYVLVGVPLAAAVLTFYLVRNLPDRFVSHARLATGLVDRPDAFLRPDNFAQESRVSQEFGNLIQLITVRKLVNRVSYQLLLHDLTQTPFKPHSPLVKELNPQARQHVIATLRKKIKDGEELSLWDADEKGMYAVLKSMGYDYGSLTRNLVVYRVGSSDFVDMEFTSENPALSAFVLNTLGQEFLTDYISIVRENQNKAVSFLDSLVRQKEAAVNSKLDALKNYKIANRVLNLHEQAKALYGQVTEMEIKREEARKNVEAYSAALQQVNKKFNPEDRRYLESALININQDILSTREQLRTASNQYVQSGFEPAHKQRIDSLQARLTGQIAQSTDKTIYSPLAAKNDLVVQKLQMEVALDLSRNSIASLDAEASRLNSKIGSLVPNEAMIQAYESDIDIASREYIELLRKYNQTSMEAGYSINVRVVETAMPGEAKPSRKMLLVALAGVVSLVLCLLVLFVLFYMDDTVGSPAELANKTGVPVLGVLNKTGKNPVDAARLWSRETLPADQQALKERLRSLRFEVERELGSEKLLGVTSLSPGEGASFVAHQLAQAFVAMNKTVALVDGDFAGAGLSGQLQAQTTFEEILQKEGTITTAGGVTLIGNRGGDFSLLELATEETLRQKLALLSGAVDLVVVDMGALEGAGRSKEWTMFLPRIICVFGANRPVNREAESRITYLKGLPAQFSGWVYNHLPSGAGKKRGKKGHG